MLKFKTVRILFLISLLFFFILHFLFSLSLWWCLVPSLVYVLLLVTGSVRIQSQFYIDAICTGAGTLKEIALTFDDGPTSHTPAILSTLKAYQATATFFMIGKNTIGNELLVKQIIEEGHTIGNHSYSHSFFIDLKNTAGFKKELTQTAESIKKITGIHPLFFRPPYGVTTPHLAKAVDALNYKVIGWSIRSLDTTNDTAEIIFNRIVTQLHPGAIILLHDTSGKTNTVLKMLLQYCKQHGYSIQKLETLIKSPSKS